MTVVSWFSCGAASAVATKLALARYPGDVLVARCFVAEEHEDNDRFAGECETWFGVPILTLRSGKYQSCEEVWKDRRYMSGVKGAPCTVEMKKAVRWELEQDICPTAQVFGFTVEERARAERFTRQNPDVSLVCPLIEEGLTKRGCFEIIQAAGLELPLAYRLGFPNANCIGCVKASSPSYWARVRHHFPEVFERRARLSRELNVRLIKTTRAPRRRLFLDELPLDTPITGRDQAAVCGLLC